jgi:phosphotransferase system enzyme I (PtsI)
MTSMEKVKGVGIANGITIGKALLILDEETVIIEQTVAPDLVEQEVSRFNQAVETAKEQIRTIKDQVKGRIGEEHAFIFETHVLLLEDRGLKAETIKFIREKKCNAEYAFSQVLMSVLKQFSSLGDSFFVERGNDLKDVGKRVLKVLKGSQDTGFRDLGGDVVVIGHDFGPSNITHFDNPRILGFATDLGGPTTHTAIIAKALGLPAVLGLHDISKRVKSGDMVVLDSFTGKVFINPDKETLAHYRKLIKVFKEEEANYLKEIEKPALSLDGVEIQLLANIELPNEVNPALRYGARGVGLYRTEFLFLQCDPTLPTEKVHYDTYCQIAEEAKDLPVTIRTLDLGGEKFFHRTFVREKEINPVMGLRGIRLCLKRKDIFRTQLRGLLHAAHDYPNIQIMFPLVSGVSEWYATRNFVETVKREMRDEGLPYAENPRLGVMIEVPSAAMVADYLADEVSFFSIGTNDLIQYFLAIDRANDDVSYLYNPFHPGFVRLLSQVVKVANEKNIEVSCCGEMASSPIYACLLIQLGLRQLSMNPTSIPIIHHLVRGMDFGKLDQLVPDPTGGPTGSNSRALYLQAFRQILEQKDYQHLIDDLGQSQPATSESWHPL